MARTSRSVRGKHHLRREEGGSPREQVSQHVSRKAPPREHAPVMLAEAIDALDLQRGDIVVDATFGKGGHSKAIKKVKGTKLVTIDADPDNRADITGNFGDLKSLLAEQGIVTIDKALFDLGWNMTQLGSGRGFSFLTDEPLDMSYGKTPRSSFTAAEMLNTFSEKAIADIIFGYGEERYAKRIARRVVERRDIAPFNTTFELVEVVRDAVPPAYRHGRIHPATRTFQALRIAVNDELGALKAGLTQAWEMLSEGGRIAVITFHSTEDRVVKQLFKEFVARTTLATSSKGSPCYGELVSKKPLVPTKTEITTNPASRSAKLRAIIKR